MAAPSLLMPTCQPMALTRAIPFLTFIRSLRMTANTYRMVNSLLIEEQWAN